MNGRLLDFHSLRIYVMQRKKCTSMRMAFNFLTRPIILRRFSYLREQLSRDLRIGEFVESCSCSTEIFLRKSVQCKNSTGAFCHGIFNANSTLKFILLSDTRSLRYFLRIWHVPEVGNFRIHLDHRVDAMENVDNAGKCTENRAL